MNDTFIRACRGQKTDYTPVWMMRQAGRFLPDYKKVAKQASFLEMCRKPELAAEVTMQPVRALGVDAAIFFSDILTTVVPMGMNLVYTDGKGPSFTNLVRTAADVERLTVPDPMDGLRFVYDAQKIILNEMPDTPLIGFAGSPLTVAAYMIDGSSHNFHQTRSMIFGEPALFRKLMDKVTRLTLAYLKMQARAGAHAVMLFDSFAGMLGPRDYLAVNLPYNLKIIQGLKSAGVPVIYFGLGQHGAYPELGASGADVIGIDHYVDLSIAAKQLGRKVTVQGNIEPYVLIQGKAEMEKRVKEVLAAGSKARAHIFNLGHGVPLTTPVPNAKAMVDAVHKFSRA
jgi:uroporphyrinogen decarboxylase